MVNNDFNKREEKYKAKQIPFGLYKKVAERSGYKCYRCNNYYEQTNKMQIHHLDYNAKNNDYGNLIYLCYLCHRLLHNNKRIFDDK